MMRVTEPLADRTGARRSIRRLMPVVIVSIALGYGLWLQYRSAQSSTAVAAEVDRITPALRSGDESAIVWLGSRDLLIRQTVAAWRSALAEDGCEVEVTAGDVLENGTPPASHVATFAVDGRIVLRVRLQYSPSGGAEGSSTLRPVGFIGPESVPE